MNLHELLEDRIIYGAIAGVAFSGGIAVYASYVLIRDLKKFRRKSEGEVKIDNFEKQEFFQRGDGE